MSRVTRVGVVEHLELVLIVDNSGTALSENGRGLTHDGLEHRLEGGEDEGVDLRVERVNWRTRAEEEEWDERRWSSSRRGKKDPGSSRSCSRYP